MKKYVTGLILLLCSTQLFAFDEQVYHRLINGELDNGELILKNADLRGVIISDIDLTNVKFYQSNLTGAQFSNVTLQNIEFDQTYLDGTRFIDCTFINCKIKNKTSFNYATFEGTTFDNSTIESASFNFLTIQNTRFINTRITKVAINDIADERGFKIIFIACSMNDITFVRSIIKGLIIHNPNELRDLNFSCAKLKQCIILGKEATSTLVKANFEAATLYGCFLLNIKFENCQLATILSNTKSIYKNVSSTDERDFAILKSLGAKVNGCYDGAYKDEWNNKPGAIDTLLPKLGWGIFRGGVSVGTAVVVKLALAGSCNIQ